MLAYRPPQSADACPRENRRGLCVFSSWGSTTGDEMWLMESVTKEVRNACTTPSWQPPARAICPLEAARDFAARESSDGGLDRHGGLDRDGDAGREDSREEAEERGGAATAVASDAWGADVDGDSEMPYARRRSKFGTTHRRAICVG